MAWDRWYPSVTRSSDDMMVVSGGSKDTGPQVPENTTEHFFPGQLAGSQWRIKPGTTQKWFHGPVAAGHTLDLYPRIFQLSIGEMFLAGPRPQNDRVDVINTPEVWTVMHTSSLNRHDGAAFLYPDPYGQENRVMILGGSAGVGHAMVHDKVEICRPQQSSSPARDWGHHSTMKHRRVHQNAVVLPDASIVVIGGNDMISGSPAYHFQPELLAYGSTTWTLLAPAASERDYHSTAVLLPDGRVLTGGGDNRRWDYQIFAPPYFDASEDELGIWNIALSSTSWAYRSTGAGPYSATFSPLPSGISVAHVVLMAPGSTTHHSDFDQRYVDLEIAGQSNASVVFYPPQNHCEAPSVSHSCAPRGYYLVFLVSNLGVPYGAGFIRLL